MSFNPCKFNSLHGFFYACQHTFTMVVRCLRQGMSDFFSYPCHDEIDDVLLLFFCQCVTGFDIVPFRETFPAAGTCGVLRDENRVTAHGGLFAVIGNMGRCKTETDEVTGMPDDRIQSYFIDIPALLFSQVKACTEM